MAAAAWSRSRGAAGVRATTGLFSIFTLLCLVCLSSSLTYKEQLEKAKEELQKTEKQLEELKAIDVPAMDTAKHHAGEAASIMESVEALVRANEEEFPGDSQGVVLGMKDYIERSKNIVDQKDEEMRAQIKEAEKVLESLRKFVTPYEEQHAEL